MFSILLLPGDGVGPDVVREGKKIIEKVALLRNLKIKFETKNIGGCAIDNDGSPLSEETLRACRSSTAILLGAVGGPKWTGNIRPEQGLLSLRKELGTYTLTKGLFANIRPCFFPGFAALIYQ
jgi:3-isopropylmalate dehydrogenase